MFAYAYGREREDEIILDYTTPILSVKEGVYCTELTAEEKGKETA
jgi:hypothetical protein